MEYKFNNGELSITISAESEVEAKEALENVVIESCHYALLGDTSAPNYLPSYLRPLDKWIMEGESTPFSRRDLYVVNLEAGLVGSILKEAESDDFEAAVKKHIAYYIEKLQDIKKQQIP